MIYYKVAEADLIELLELAHELHALHQGGVDNWEWCGESCSDYQKEYRKDNPEIKQIMEENNYPYEVYDNEHPDFYEIAQYELKYYERIKGVE